MDFLRFLTSKLFLKNLGLALGILLLLILGVLLWLRIYTHHGQAITVPDLSGLSLEEVSDVCDSRQLRFVVVDSVFTQDMPRGTVIKHHPRPMSRVKKNRMVFLTMNAVNPEMIKMPQLVGLSIRQAKLALQNAGLILGEIEYQPDYAINNVLQQKYQDSLIIEGTEIDKHAVIDLVLGMGLSNETTRVPNLLRLSLEEARSAIADHFLNIGAITYDEDYSMFPDTARILVWRQYPEFDTFRRLNMGMEVDIWLSADSTLWPMPDSIVNFVDVPEE